MSRRPGLAGRLSGAWRSAGSGPLGVRSFRLLAGGQFASTIGDFCYAVALPWLVLSTHGGTVLLGTVLACYGVPRTGLIPVGGVLADKVGPRTLMLTADVARGVLVAGLAVLAARHTVSLAALGPIAALIGAGEGLFIPASFAIMPALLDGERLTAGNALSTAAVQAGSLLGPALGGALVAVTHTSTAAFGVDAGSFALARARFGAAGYGALLACFAAGALAGTLAAARTGSLRTPAMLASAVFLVEAVAISLTPYLGGEAGAAAAMFAAGACNGVGNVIFLTVLQKWVSPGMLGRVMGVMMLCAFGTYPLSAAIAGVLVRHLGPALFFPIAGGLVAAAILGGLTQREFREFGVVQAAQAASAPKAASGSRK